MKSMIQFAFLASLLLACSSGQSLKGDPGAVVADPLTTMALDSGALLPACDSVNESQLVYLLDAKQFKVCKSGTWVTIDIKGEAGAKGSDGKNGIDGSDGLRIESIWAFMDSVYTESDSLAEDVFTVIGDIRLIKFTDGSQNLVINGQTLLFETSEDLSVNDFTHTFFLPKGETTESAKLTSFANTVAFYNLRSANGSPVLDVAIDFDGDISNDTIKTFNLLRFWPEAK